jgi:hypothetical protein
MFVAHGEFRLVKKEQIIFIESKGPFNQEAVDLYALQMNEIMESFDGYWGQIITLHQDSLFTPQAEQSMKQALLYRKANGLAASAVIIHDDKARFIIQHQISRVYDEVGVEYAYIDCVDEAMRWMNEKLDSSSN